MEGLHLPLLGRAAYASITSLEPGDPTYEAYFVQRNPCIANLVPERAKGVPLDDYRWAMGTIQTRTLQEYISERFYDPAVMDTASCMISTAFYPPPEDPGFLSSNIRTKHWIADSVGITSSTSLGEIYLSSLHDTHLLSPGEVRASSPHPEIIVKTGRKDSGRNVTNAIIHEWFVGLHLNALRGLVPNFAYLYGGFRCSPAFSPRTAQGMCASMDNTQPFLAYENIASVPGAQPQKPFSEFVKTGSARDVSALLAQVFLALDTAYNAFSFTHYDLHADNVLVRDMGRDVYIPYRWRERPGEIYYIKSRYVAMIVDYDRAHIAINGGSFGVRGGESYGIFHDRPFPLFDVYRLLYAGGFFAGRASYPVFDRYLRYFSDESLRAILAAEDNPVGFLPYRRETSGPITPFLYYFFENIDGDIFVTRQEALAGVVLGCVEGSTCMSPADAISLFRTDRVGARDIFEFCDLAYLLQAKDPALVRELRENSDARTLLATAKTDLDRLMAKAEGAARNIEAYPSARSVPRTSDITALVRAQITEAEKLVQWFIVLRESINTGAQVVRAIVCLGDEYRTDTMTEDVRQNMARIEKLHERSVPYYERIIALLATIKRNILADPRIYDLIKDEKIYETYRRIRDIGEYTF